MDRLDEIEIFLAVLDTGSLAGAARKLVRSPPAVTRALSALESRIGTRLIERTTRRLAPTEAGKRLAEAGRLLLLQYEDAVREDPTAPLRGKLRVTAPIVFGRRHVAPVVNAFLDRHPAMQVELVLNNCNLDLIDEGLDVALRIGPLADASMVARRVGEVRRILVASPAYLARRGTPDSLDSLAQHDMIFTSTLSGPPEWRFRHGGRERVVPLNPRLTVNEVDAVLLAAKEGRGIAYVLSYQVADELAEGTLVRLLPEFELAALPVSLIVPSARFMAPKVRAFLDHAVEALGALPAIRPQR
ncbi:MAG TPA: LysR family transcriptional regulator [Paucimonas sp.]|nr:LysR family transcriptional regulator [Paucimonas sp.]